MNGLFLKLASWTTTAALCLGSIHLLSDRADAQGGGPPPYCDGCEVTLGAQVWPQGNPPPVDCFDSLTMSFVVHTDGECGGTGCTQQSPGNYIFALTIDGSEECCMHVRCGTPGAFDTWTETCSTQLSMNVQKNLDCGSSRIYRAFVRDAAGDQCPNQSCSSSAYLGEPQCYNCGGASNQIWYVRVNASDCEEETPRG